MLKTNLKSHQEEGTKWLMERERTEFMGCKGGIFADPTGAGKTLQLLNLIISNPLNEIEREKGINKATIVVASDILLGNWLMEIEKHTKNIRVFDTRNKECHAKDLKGCDILMISYDQLKSGWKSILVQLKEKAEKMKASLEGKNEAYREVYYNKTIKELKENHGKGERMEGLKYDGVREALFSSGVFHRVVIDEAHNAKNFKSDLFEALFHLPVRNCWWVTATPFQNSGDDIFAPLHFLRVKGINNVSAWRKENPCMYASKEGKSPDDVFETGLKKNLGTQSILDTIMLKRKKSDIMKNDESMRLEDIDTIELPVEFFHEEEKLLHEHFFGQFRKNYEKAEKAAAKGEKVKKPRKKKPKKNEEGKDPSTPPKGNEMIAKFNRARQTCSNPRDTMKDPDIPKRLAAKIEKLEKTQGGKLVFTKQKVMDVLFTNTKNDDDEEEPSDQLPSIPKEDSVIIFFQWLSTIQSIKRIIEETGRKVFVITGDTKSEDRWQIISKFQKSKGSVLMASLKIASVGLNLTNANWVITFDPWWNPQIRRQAIDRVHRLGQTKQVHAIDIFIKDSIEERVYRCQDQKLKLSTINLDMPIDEDDTYELLSEEQPDLPFMKRILNY